MSDIVPFSPQTPPPGWYVDQTGQQRWWDGTAWGVYAPTAAAPTVFVQARKETGIAYLFAIFLGGFGAHHFYLGRVGAGIGFILLWWIGWFTTFLLVGFVLLFAAAVWWIIDLCLIPSYVRNANARITR